MALQENFHERVNPARRCGSQAALPMNRPLPVAIIASLLALHTGLASPLSAAAEADGEGHRYYVDGKPVAAEVFRGQQLSNEGGHLLEQGRYQEALPRLQEAVELAPALSTAQYNLGLVLGKLGRTEEAEAHLKKALSLDPDYAQALLVLGGLYQSSGRLEESIDTYRRFLSRFPGREEASRISNVVSLLDRQKQRQARQAAAGPAAAAADDFLPAKDKSSWKRWDGSRMPLKVYIADGAGVPGYRKEFAAILERCFRDWQAAAGGGASFTFVAAPGSADIRCSWVSDRQMLRNPAEGAEARKNVDNTGRILDSELIFVTVTFPSGRSRSDHQMRLIGLHEIGHALGLGHSSNPRDVMFYSNSLADLHRELSERDRQAIRRLYPMPAP